LVINPFTSRESEFLKRIRYKIFAALEYGNQL